MVWGRRWGGGVTYKNYGSERHSVTVCFKYCNEIPGFVKVGNILKQQNRQLDSQKGKVSVTWNQQVLCLIQWVSTERVLYVGLHKRKYSITLWSEICLQR